MIRSFKITSPKDDNGLYILPKDIIHREEILHNLKYHEREMRSVMNLMFAIICAVNQNKLKDTDVNGWTYKYVRINNVLLNFENFFLDETENNLYEIETDDELVMIQRNLKLKRIKK